MNIENIKEKLKCSGYDCFTNDFFTENFKKGIVNHVSYDGQPIEQTPKVVDTFNELIKKVKPKRIVEIGTFYGGLTLIIKDILNLNDLNHSELITYEVSDNYEVFSKLKEKGIIVKNKNLFSYSYMYFESNETEKEIYDIINQEGISIVLCDGGSKKNEFNLLSNLLKKGDIIMAHDYAPNEIFFKQKMINNYWNWLEIQDSDIDFVCKKNNLVPYMNEEFIEVAWVCKIKI